MYVTTRRRFEGVGENHGFSPDFVTQKHVFYNLLINNILYLCVT